MSSAEIYHVYKLIYSTILHQFFFKFLKEVFLFRRKIILKRLISVYKNKKEEIFSFFFKKKINEKARIQEIDLKDVLDLFFILKRN